MTAFTYMTVLHKQDRTTANSNWLILVPPYGTKVELMQNSKAYKRFVEAKPFVAIVFKK
jgi:hypothetical protein